MTFDVFCHRILKTQDHRVVWVEKDIKNHLVPTALPWPGTPSTKRGYPGPLPTWNISRDMHSLYGGAAHSEQLPNIQSTPALSAQSHSPLLCHLMPL